VPDDHAWGFIATEEDTGPFVKALLAVPAGKNLYAYRELAPLKTVVEMFSKVLGVPARVKRISFQEAVDLFGDEIGEEVAEIFEYSEVFGYEARADKTVIHPKEVSVATPAGIA
jgi:hypothetical protein